MPVLKDGHGGVPENFPALIGLDESETGAGEKSRTPDLLITSLVASCLHICYKAYYLCLSATY
jgi:hypothetical protein